MARERGPDGIRVNCIVPGAILTERQEKLRLAPEMNERFIDLQALEFRLDARDVARVALFLASAESAGCTGANFIAPSQKTLRSARSGTRPWICASSRNLLAIEAEELLRSLPVDGAVLLGGCNKTTPCLLMGAISMDLPVIFCPAGPMSNGKWRGERVSAGTHTKNTGTKSAPVIFCGRCLRHGRADRPSRRVPGGSTGDRAGGQRLGTVLATSFRPGGWQNAAASPQVWHCERTRHRRAATF